jgi:hypothetical protein
VADTWGVLRTATICARTANYFAQEKALDARPAPSANCFADANYCSASIKCKALFEISLELWRLEFGAF